MADDRAAAVRQVIADLRELAGEFKRAGGSTALSKAWALNEAADRVEAALGEAPASPSSCESTCNPFTAPCGAKFCTFEEQQQHIRQHAADPPPTPTPPGRGPHGG